MKNSTMSQTEKYDIFIAHNSKDKPFVRTLVMNLETHNISCWYDEARIAPGDVFATAIRNILPAALTIGICLSDSGLGPWQQGEYQAAIGLAKATHLPLIPILLPCAKEIPHEQDFLSRYSWVKFSSPDDCHALEALSRAISKEKTNRHPEKELLQKGHLALKKGNNADAIKYLTNAIIAARDWYAAYVLRALAFRDAGQLKDAISDFDLALTLNPDDPKIYHMLGIVRHSALNDKNGAIQEFDQAIAISPDFADAYYDKAVAQLSEGDTLAARESFEKAASFYLQQGDREQHLKAREGAEVLEAEGKSWLHKWMKGASILKKEIGVLCTKSRKVS